MAATGGEAAAAVRMGVASSAIANVLVHPKACDDRGWAGTGNRVVRAPVGGVFRSDAVRAARGGVAKKPKAEGGSRHGRGSSTAAPAAPRQNARAGRRPRRPFAWVRADLGKWAAGTPPLHKKRGPARGPQVRESQGGENESARGHHPFTAPGIARRP